LLISQSLSIFLNILSELFLPGFSSQNRSPFLNGLERYFLRITRPLPPELGNALGDPGGGWKTGKVIASYRGNNGWRFGVFARNMKKILKEKEVIYESIDEEFFTIWYP